MIKDKSMGRKLIFLDIDGTLLPPGDMLIPESTLAALDRARANGHKLFLCTGRNHRMTEPLLRHDCFAGAVCSAGGYVLCDGKTLVDIPMEPQQAEGVRAALERNGVECTLEARDATFGGSKMAERWKFIHKKNDAPLNSEAERWRKAMEEGMSILPLSDYKGEPLYKIVFIADHESDLAEAKQLYADQFVFCESKLDSLTDGFVNGELINRKFDKGTGIKAICDHLGCTLADTVVNEDGEVLADLHQLVIAHRAQMRDGGLGVVERVDRLIRRSAGAAAFAVAPLGLALLNVRAVTQHDAAEIARLACGVNGAVEPVFEKQRQIAGVVDVRMGQKDKVDLPRRHRQLLVFKDVLPLLHAAVNKAAVIPALDECAAARNFMGRAQKGNFHSELPCRGASPTLCGREAAYFHRKYYTRSPPVAQDLLHPVAAIRFFVVPAPREHGALSGAPLQFPFFRQHIRCLWGGHFTKFLLYFL